MIQAAIDLEINLNLLEGYSNIQRNLLDKMASLYSLSDYLQSIPKDGEIYISSTPWNFKKHGAGIRFVNEITGVVVDANTICREDFGAFDAWRISIYIESLGLRPTQEKDVSRFLNILKEDGFLTELRGGKFFVLNKSE